MRVTSKHDGEIDQIMGKIIYIGPAGYPLSWPHRRYAH